MTRFRWMCLVLLLALPTLAAPGRRRHSVPPLPPIIQNDETLLPTRASLNGQPLSLVEAYQLTYAHQPALGSAEAKVAQAQARLNQQYALYAPSLSFSYNKTLLRESFTLPGLPGNLLDSSSLGLQLNQTLFDFGQRRALVDAYRESLRAALFSWQSAWVQQAQLVQQAYIEQSRAEYLLAIAQDNYTRVSTYAEVSRRFYQGGVKSRVDVTQVEIQLAQAQLQVAQAKNQVRSNRATLAQTIGIDVKELESRELRDEIFEIYPMPKGEQARQAVQKNPQVLALEAQVRFNEAASEAQWKQALPTFNGVAGYGGQGVEVPTEVRVWTVGLTLNFPFYQPTIQPTAELYDATAQQYRKDRDSTVLALLQQLESALATVEAAQQRTTIAADEVSISLKNFQLAYKRYASGLSDLTELINARSFLFTAQNDYVNALHDKKVAEGQLRLTQGYQPEPMIQIEGLEYAP